VGAEDGAAVGAGVGLAVITVSKKKENENKSNRRVFTWGINSSRSLNINICT
jgi:hypothetical protein